MARELTTEASPPLIQQDIACIRCEYNLRTLAKTGRCPECGLEVARTLAAIQVADARWLRRMTWTLRLSFLAAAFSLQLLDVWWDPMHSMRLLLWGATLIAFFWLVTARIPNCLGSSSITRTRWIVRAAVTGMALVFFWSYWRQYDREGNEALVSLSLIIGLIACFAHLSDVARHLKLPSLARPLLAVPVLLVLGMMPREIGYWRYMRFRIRPLFDQMAWYYAGVVVHVVGWIFALLVIGRLLYKLDQLRGIGTEPSLANWKPTARLRWGIVLLGVMPVIYFLLSPPLVWPWRIAFPMAIVTYVTGLYLISSDIADRVVMRAALRASAIILLLTSIAPFVASWNILLYGHPAILAIFLVLFVSLVLSVCLSFILLRGTATRLGYNTLAKSFARHSRLVPLFLLLWLAMVWAIRNRDELHIPWDTLVYVRGLLGHLILLAILESSLPLGRLWQAMVETEERPISGCRPPAVIPPASVGV